MLISGAALGQSFAPNPGQVGSTAIYKDSNVFVSWADNVSVTRGLKKIDDPNAGEASYGLSAYALGKADGDGLTVVSLGDRGEALLYFHKAIKNENGPDFAVFENGFQDDYLELAFVEVSNDGINFYRFPSYSETPSAIQSSNASYTDTRYIHNLAGKYKQGYGTPFDLSDLDSINDLDLQQIHYIKIIDVVGNIDPNYASYDSQGRIINDPWPTNFESGGFDLDAVGVIHQQVVADLNENQIIYIEYGNPVNDELKIVLHERCTYEMVNTSGQLLKTGEVIPGENLISLVNMNPGFYVLLLQNENGSIRSIKIQKQ